MSSTREELIANAVSFLKDAQVSSSPLEKKVEFLESKGLTKEEIEEAMKRSQESVDRSPPAQSSSGTQSSSGSEQGVQSYHQQAHSAPQYYTPAPPPVPEKDWKDYFIMATATVGVGFALYEITKRYLIPNVLPDSKSKLDKDKEAIEEEFLRIEATLKEIADTQQQLKEGEAEKAKAIDAVIDSVQDLVNDSKEKNSKVEDEVKYLKSEIENLKASLDRALDKQQSSIANEVASIQHELNSLQQLIKSKNSLAKELGSNGTKETATSPVPPASSIPSASEILKRANLATSSAVSSPQPQSSSHISSNPQIPSWQRSAAVNTPATSALLSEESLPERPDSVAMNHKSYSQSTAQQEIPLWQQAASANAVATVHAEQSLTTAYEQEASEETAESGSAQ
ncbi:uncharacterized protein CYBJADRAFT_166849 [Cyberlindnera jadinii NRRL Y-1542]|uniref:Peroxisomal membrane protein PEX14 n=1 Tax=Cyberlindnera jadinii (strain ATCC 18201 / CBS 1600 / BCRC 20928 / JCM 3617 / NBRC 0987 / NRRL Y-1542) TaxID=983966 RepID=A0A1E4S3S7_CYBJN|nr:hypothetical protein CYBJADRAFT_169919 [Cyberlindnera jadinii NRRL Y-1542]XP_020071149.1 hypothetical protein CYBJADRAFT_166849 [Cyberlindnera jadinii NRRL Y-1542]ODV70860.1 hypothetical protein CYBJADRAFT_169919 [Cyberlindnera jadinii NRRL Y-1542]ODV74110.1 hypothetical protein CYBJADRAFT_166849 [Cyberlindnera jadinii NRRL Y-1542]